MTRPCDDYKPDGDGGCHNCVYSHREPPPVPPSPPPAYSVGSEPSGDPSRTCCLVEGFEGRAPRCVQLARDVEMLLAKRTKQDEVIARLRAELAVAAPQADSGPHPDVMADPAQESSP